MNARITYKALAQQTDLRLRISAGKKNTRILARTESLKVKWKTMQILRTSFQRSSKLEVRKLYFILISFPSFAFILPFLLTSFSLLKAAPMEIFETEILAYPGESSTLSTVIMPNKADTFEFPNLWNLSSYRFRAGWAKFCEHGDRTDPKKSKKSPACFAGGFVSKVGFFVVLQLCWSWLKEISFE